MARSAKYWYDVMMNEKTTFANLTEYQPNIDSSQTLFTDLATTSKVSRPRLVFWCIACAMYAFDVALDLYKSFLAGLVEQARYGTLPWYVLKSKEFQYGDSLVQVDYEWKYSPVNTTNQIVKLAAAKEAPGFVNLKIAKLTGTVPGPLSGGEETAFKAYINKIKPAGINVNVINAASDEIRLYLTVNYDPLVLASNGESLLTAGVFPVEDAITNYKNNLDFDGAFEIMSAIDAVQLVDGVVSVYEVNAEARYGTNPFVSFPQRYYPNAGHLVIDPSTPLSGSITYVANV